MVNLGVLVCVCILVVDWLFFCLFDFVLVAITFGCCLCWRLSGFRLIGWCFLFWLVVSFAFLVVCLVLMVIVSLCFLFWFGLRF